MAANPSLFENRLPESPPLLGNQYRSVEASGPLLDKVFSLRYKSYRADNYIQENGTAKLIDKYDGQSNCASYLTYSSGSLLGSIRCCVFSPDRQLAIPAMEVFHKQIQEYVGIGEILLEVNKFVVDPAFRKSGAIGAKFAIYSNVIGAVDRSKSSCVIVAVRPDHIRFYKTMFYEQVSGEKPYPGLDFKTVLMVCRDLEPARNLIEKQKKRRNKA